MILVRSDPSNQSLYDTAKWIGDLVDYVTLNSDVVGVAFASNHLFGTGHPRRAKILTSAVLILESKLISWQKMFIHVGEYFEYFGRSIYHVNMTL